MLTVSEWLNQLGLGHLTETFRKNDIDLDILRTLTDADLKELGIDSLGARRKMIGALTSLPSAISSPTTPTDGAAHALTGATMFPPLPTWVIPNDH